MIRDPLILFGDRRAGKPYRAAGTNEDVDHLVGHYSHLSEDGIDIPKAVFTALLEPS